jgi:hypothetical protein
MLKRLEQILSRLVKIFFENNIVSLVKIQIQFFGKNHELFVKRIEQILSILVKKCFKNNIVLLVKIQIYSNSQIGSHL